MFQKLRTVIYHIKDLEKAKKWYEEITEKKPYFDEPFYVGFDINGCELGLDPDFQNVKSGNQAVAYWAVENIETAAEKLLKAKAKLVSPITNVGGDIRVATFSDPFGNQFGIIEGAD